MKVLVTGGSGFIGSAFVRLAVSRGLHVVNLDALTYAANSTTHDALQDNPLYHFEHADIRDAVSVSRIIQRHQPDLLIHLAAESHVDRSIAGPDCFMQTNIIGTYNLLQAWRSHWVAQGQPAGMRFHQVSTDEVFGSLPDHGFFDEDTPYDPRNPYSASKAAADHLVMAWHHTYGLPVVLSNSSNNYGPYHFPEKLVPVTILNAILGKEIPIYGKGDNIRDWLHVEDHAAALLTVLQHGTTGKSYAIGASSEVSNIELVHLICNELDRQRPTGTPYSNLIRFVPDRPGHDQRYAINAKRIQRDLGWTPAISLSDGIASTVDWYLRNEAWWRPLLLLTDSGSGPDLP